MTWIEIVRELFRKKLNRHLQRCRECRDLGHDCGAAVQIRRRLEFVGGALQGAAPSRRPTAQPDAQGDGE